MNENFILPVAYHGVLDLYKAREELMPIVTKWINTHCEVIRSVYSKSSLQQEVLNSASPEDTVDQILKILIHRTFNYQSKKNLHKIINNVKQKLLKHIKKRERIKIFLLYNGGYRSSFIRHQNSLIFEPDQTELMLLYQIALLNNKINAVYNYGIEFNIVVNNGVAKWVNDISIELTEHYANQIRKMIMSFGAENSMRVLLQSELRDFSPDLSIDPLVPKASVTDQEHLIVERFLGKPCSKKEAEYYSALYILGETKWAEDLAPIIHAKNGIVMRQVGHPEMLSFRSFPGGAIRIQNGTLGFQYINEKLRPKLFTSKFKEELKVDYIELNVPFNTKNQVN